MNLAKLQRGLEHLAVLLEIRADKKKKRDEDDLKLLLIALILSLFDDWNYREFENSFIAALLASYSALDPNGEYDELIRKEIAVQRGYLHNFVQDLKNGKLSEAQAKARAGMYATSLGKLRWQITLTDNGDRNMMWKYNESVLDHCPDCIELDGTVRKASTWLATIYPRSGNTQCLMACQCDLVPV